MMTGLPLSWGLRRHSTDTKNVSRSKWAICLSVVFIIHKGGPPYRVAHPGGWPTLSVNRISFLNSYLFYIHHLYTAKRKFLHHLSRNAIKTRVHGIPAMHLRKMNRIDPIEMHIHKSAEAHGIAANGAHRFLRYMITQHRHRFTNEILQIGSAQVFCRIII